MRKLRSLLVAALFLTPGCSLFHRAPKITIANTAPVIGTTQQLQVSETKLGNQAAGYTVAEQKVLSLIPPSREKDAASEIMTDQLYLLGNPDPATRTEFETWAMNLVATDAAKVSAAEAQRQVYATQANDLKTQITTLQATQSAQLQTLKSAQALELANAQSAADAKVKSIVSYIFFGLAALCMLGAIAVGALAASYPLFGPKAAMALAGAGIASGATGVAIIKLLDISVMYWGIGAVVLLIAIAVTLIHANHAHAVAAPNVTKS